MDVNIDLISTTALNRHIENRRGPIQLSYYPSWIFTIWSVRQDWSKNQESVVGLSEEGTTVATRLDSWHPSAPRLCPALPNLTQEGGTLTAQDAPQITRRRGFSAPSAGSSHHLSLC